MTGSEDGSVSVYSIQTQKLVQSINIPGISGSCPWTGFSSDKNLAGSGWNTQH